MKDKAEKEKTGALWVEGGNIYYIYKVYGGQCLRCM